ncbi:MAG: hypothetical protein ACI85K_000289 [Hyphomicrobiaceae bacterium]|jgi:hypothetical protein
MAAVQAIIETVPQPTPAVPSLADPLKVIELMATNGPNT